MADTKICSDISGSIWKVLVNIGDKIEAEVPLVILESMKMEIPVVSSDPGVVVEIYVAVGDAVAEGDPILLIRE
ncbi:MAG: acetyl-CoA carboxylase biotin carboxyl carrier protein subunit [Candidatus Binataceae bacterium]|nr:acetyl-CoA carboxylase biotin carboxyl carrier protein subunit [Candidatus Binataceae bacterium]